MGSNSASENLVLPGSPNDNNMNVGGLNANQDEDDHDPAAPVIYDLAVEKTQLTAVPSFLYNEVVQFKK